MHIGQKIERRNPLNDYWTDSVQDIRYTFRTLARDPGSASVSIVILAIAIGANVAVFSIVNTLLLARKSITRHCSKTQPALNWSGAPACRLLPWPRACSTPYAS